jgi:hypothetical protein
VYVWPETALDNVVHFSDATHEKRSKQGIF